MKPDEIKIALGRCCSASGCLGCLYYCGDCSCQDNLGKDALDYINKLEAEVESITEKFDCQQQVYADLSKIIKTQKTEIDGLKSRNINNCRHWQKKYSSLRTKAIKEFSERLKEKAENATTWVEIEPVVTVKNIDNLVKEMVGEVL